MRPRPTKSMILRGPRSCDWRGKHLPYSRPSSSSIQRLLTASLGIRLVGASSVSLPPAFWPEVARSAAPPLPTKFIILRGPHPGDWRGKHLPYSRPSSSSIQRLLTASLGIRLVGASSVSLPPAFWPEVARSAAPPLPTKFIILRGPHPGDWRGKRLLYSRPSSSSIQRLLTASLGMRQSPRGLRATEPTLGPSARQERLNCWEKKRR